MSKRTTDIFSQSEHIRERIEQAYRRVIGAPGSPRFSVPFMEPAVDVYETDDAVVIVMEIAGIAEEEIELEVDGASLILKGCRTSAREGPRRAYSQMEICDGPFQRELLLPADVNAEGATAIYRDGMLEISLPKAAPTLSRQLKIVVR